MYPSLFLTPSLQPLSHSTSLPFKMTLNPAKYRLLTLCDLKSIKEVQNFFKLFQNILSFRIKLHNFNSYCAKYISNPLPLNFFFQALRTLFMLNSEFVEKSTFLNLVIKSLYPFTHSGCLHDTFSVAEV